MFSEKLTKLREEINKNGYTIKKHFEENYYVISMDNFYHVAIHCSLIKDAPIDYIVKMVKSEFDKLIQKQ